MSEFTEFLVMWAVLWPLTLFYLTLVALHHMPSWADIALAGVNSAIMAALVLFMLTLITGCST